MINHVARIQSGLLPFLRMTHHQKVNQVTLSMRIPRALLQNLVPSLRMTHHQKVNQVTLSMRIPRALLQNLVPSLSMTHHQKVNQVTLSMRIPRALLQNLVPSLRLQNLAPLVSIPLMKTAPVLQFVSARPGARQDDVLVSRLVRFAVSIATLTEHV